MSGIAKKPSPAALTALLSSCTAGTVDEKETRDDKSDMSDGESKADLADIAANFGRELFVGVMQFRPIHIVGTWNDPEDFNSDRDSRPERDSCAWTGTSARVLYVILKASAPALAADSTIPGFDAI